MTEGDGTRKRKVEYGNEGREMGKEFEVVCHEKMRSIYPDQNPAYPSFGVFRFQDRHTTKYGWHPTYTGHLPAFRSHMTVFWPFMKIIQGLLISHMGITTHLRGVFEVLRQKLDTPVIIVRS